MTQVWTEDGMKNMHEDKHLPRFQAACLALVILGFSGCTAYCAHVFAPVAVANLQTAKGK